MILQFDVKNFKALRDVSLNLTPMHVLIGPNDSGKTTLLQALMALSCSVSRPFAEIFPGYLRGQELVWRGKKDVLIEIRSKITIPEGNGQYGICCDPFSGLNGMLGNDWMIVPGYEEKFQFWVDVGVAKGGSSSLREIYNSPENLPINHFLFRPIMNFLQNSSEDVSGEPEKFLQNTRAMAESLVEVHLYQWFPRLMALPVAPDSRRRFRMDSSGFGLAMLLDDILGFDRDKFIDLENRFRDIFPWVKAIRLIQEPAFRAPDNDPMGIPMLEKAEGKGIYFQPTYSEELISATQASDGMLVILAYLALLNLPRPPRLLLIEEPETGLHPKRLQEVLGILRTLLERQNDTQLIMTTHSPYVLDLFAPEEVTLCQRGDDGSISLHPLSQSATVREQIDVFTLGEIWTAEGDEALTRRIADIAP